MVSRLVFPINKLKLMYVLGCGRLINKTRFFIKLHKLFYVSVCAVIVKALPVIWQESSVHNKPGSSPAWSGSRAAALARIATRFSCRLV